MSHVTHRQHGYDVCATKYSMLARLAPTETPFSHNTSSPEHNFLDDVHHAVGGVHVGRVYRDVIPHLINLDTILVA